MARYCHHDSKIGLFPFSPEPLRPIIPFDRFGGIMMPHVSSAPPSPSHSAGGEEPIARRPERVLLAEDSLVNQRFATHQLGKLGFHSVDIVTDGFAALQAVLRGDYDIVMMDCQMPEMDGYEATREIRRQKPGGVRPRIIAMTANSDEGDRERCLEAGMNGYIAKPVRLEELATALQPVAETDPDPEGQSAIPPIDDASLAQLRSLEEGDGEEEGALAELVSLFFRDAPGTLERLATAIGQKNTEEIVAAAHLLKSNVAYFGARRLHELCEAVERGARANDLTGAPERLPAIRSEFQRVLHALEAHRPQPKP